MPVIALTLAILMLLMAYLGGLCVALVIGFVIYNCFPKLWRDYNDFLRYISFNVIDFNAS